MVRLACFVMALAAFAAPAAAQGPGGPMPVSVAPPLVHTVTDTEEFTGRFEASGYVEVRAQVSGTLEAINFKDGSLVEKGDLLFVLDKRPFEVGLAQAQGQLEAVQTRLDLARSEFERGAALRRNDNIAESTLQTRQQAFLEAQASFQSAQAAVDRAELDLDYAEIRAPIAGRTSRKLVTEGNLVNGGTTSGNSTLLTTIVAIVPIHFYFDVDEQSFLNYARLIQKGLATRPDVAGLKVRIALSDETEFSIDGVIDFTDNQLDPQSGTLRLRAVVPNDDRFIVSGTFGRVQVVVGDPHEALLVPQASVMADQTRKIVLTVDGEGTVVPKPVEVGQRVGDYIVVNTGLTPEDRVVVNGLMRTRPGGKVVPQPTELQPPGADAASDAPAATPGPG